MTRSAASASVGDNNVFGDSDEDGSLEQGDMQICHGCLEKGNCYKSYHTIFLCPGCINCQRRKQAQFKKSPETYQEALQQDIVLMLPDGDKWRLTIKLLCSENRIEQKQGLAMAEAFAKQLHQTSEVERNVKQDAELVCTIYGYRKVTRDYFQ